MTEFEDQLREYKLAILRLTEEELVAWEAIPDGWTLDHRRLNPWERSDWPMIKDACARGLDPFELWVTEYARFEIDKERLGKLVGTEYIRKVESGEA